MRKILLATLMAWSFVAAAQKRMHTLNFKKDQIQLSPEQQKELLDIAGRTKEAELITILPLTYDSLQEQYLFAGVAAQQAAEIGRYVASIGFEVLSTPSNFPSGFKGRSYAVHVRLIRHVIADVKTTYFAPKASQFFLIDPKRDTMITGNEGTKLHFPAGCLLTRSKVTVELKEYYSMADYIKDGLPSVSNGEMIESGGVIYLNATETDSKKQARINPDKGIGAAFTLAGNKTDMQVFIKDPSAEGMNWIVQDNDVQIKKSWKMTETIYDGEHNIISQKTYNSKEEWEKHLQEEAEKERLQTAAVENKIKTDNMLQLYKLGFINCDRFTGLPQKPFAVNLDKYSSANYYLVFNDVRGVMSGRTTDKLVDFGSVPVNKQATLVAIAFDGSQAYYYSSPVTTGAKPEMKISLKPVDETFINGELAKLH